MERPSLTKYVPPPSYSFGSLSAMVKDRSDWSVCVGSEACAAASYLLKSARRLRRSTYVRKANFAELQSPHGVQLLTVTLRVMLQWPPCRVSAGVVRGSAVRGCPLDEGQGQG